MTKQLSTAQKVAIMFLLFLLVPTIYASAGPHGFSDPSGAPIDGGISLLVAAGIGYGAKKVHAAKKKAAGQENNGQEQHNKG